MTTQEKLDTYAQACDLLLSIPGFGWPVRSLCHCKNVDTEKVNGSMTLQAWYCGNGSWTVIILESWDENGQRNSTKKQHDDQTSIQAANLLGES